MKHPSGDAVPRLVERKGFDAAEDRAAALLRGSLVPRDPHAAELERIARAVATRTPSRGHTRLALRVALAAVCLLAGAATVRGYEMARRAGWLGGHATTPAAKPVPATPSKRREASGKALARPAADEVVAAPLVPATQNEQAPDSPRAAQARPALHSSPRPATRPHVARDRQFAGLMAADQSAPAEPLMPLAPPAQPPPPIAPVVTAAPSAPLTTVVAPSASPPLPVARASAQPPLISQEVRELDRAIGILRRDHDAVAALGALDSYLGRYPHGVLEKEARLARIDALLLLGRHDQALSALDAITFDPGLRSTELLVVRAELRAAQDCRGAEQDFSAALGRGPDPRLLERIYYGRGVCRTKMQDWLGAHEDLQRYLDRSPGGAHADWARRWMAGRRSSSEIER